MFHPNRDADQVVGEPPGGPHSCGDAGMTHVAGQADAAAQAAKADRDLEQLSLLHNHSAGFSTASTTALMCTMVHDQQPWRMSLCINNSPDVCYSVSTTALTSPMVAEQQP